VTDPQAWHALGWFLVAGVCPALLLVLAILGLRWRRRAPLWLPLVACVALLAYVAWLWLPPRDWTVLAAVVSAWLLIPCAVLACAAFAIANRWRSRGALLVTGLAVPAPLLGLFFVYFLAELVSL
jgi:hypothetical protein